MTSLAVRAALVTRGSPTEYNTAAMTDAALVSAALNGNPAAFSALVDRHARICLRYATRMLGNIQDAEDVTQETFVRAHGALARYDGRVAFRTWLLSILINRCRTAMGVQRRRDAVVVDGVDMEHVGTDAPDDLALRDAIERALARLEPAQREAFLLKHVEQLSYEEMARVTGAGVSALKMRVQRACERLQSLLEDDRNA